MKSFVYNPDAGGLVQRVIFFGGMMCDDSVFKYEMIVWKCATGFVF